MSIVEKYKKKKENKIPVHLVINSNIDYKDHKLNILKECLNKWSENENVVSQSEFSYSWIYTNINSKEKLFFINTNKEQLKRHYLLDIIENPIVSACSYMDNTTQRSLYYIDNNSNI